MRDGHRIGGKVSRADDEKVGEVGLWRVGMQGRFSVSRTSKVTYRRGFYECEYEYRGRDKSVLMDDKWLR